ncbi:SAM-dependent methyltransferase [Chryseobacterium sp. IT-36CA2]
MMCFVLMSYILYHKYIELLSHNPEIINQYLYFLGYYSLKQYTTNIYDEIIITIIKKV